MKDSEKDIDIAEISNTGAFQELTEKVSVEPEARAIRRKRPVTNEDGESVRRKRPVTNENGEPVRRKRPAVDENGVPLRKKPLQKKNFLEDFTVIDLDDFNFRQEEAPRDEEEEFNPGIKVGRRKIGLGVILGAVIALVLVITGVSLLLWNRGTLTTWDREEENTKFDVEVQDVIFAQDPKTLEGHVDDGVTTILCLGNDPFSDDLTETGLADQIGSLGDAVVINASFPGSKVACENPIYNTDTQEGIDDAFNLYYVCSSIARDDYTAMANIVPFKNDEALTAGLEALQNTDFDTVDIIAIMYDASDYVEASPVDNPNNDVDIQTYTGSIRASIELLQETYPYIRIVFMSPTFGYYVDEDGQWYNGNETDLGNGTIPTYWQRAIDTVSSLGVSFLDNYYGSINENNYSKFMISSLHLNNAGRQQIAEHFVSKILKNEYSEFDVSGTDASKQEE